MNKACVLILAAAGAALLRAGAATTIDPLHHQAYAANLGWLDAGDPAAGVVIGQTCCAGYIYSANVGWIHLGDGTPPNGHAYLNTSAADYGVNHDGMGRLTGMAYAANIGWIVFEQAFGQPRVDLVTGILSGHVWSPNAGWIALATASAWVCTLCLDAGPDSDTDDIPDAWEYATAGDLDSLHGFGADADADGSPDVAEYEAGTDPLDPADCLRILAIAPVGASDFVTWTTNPTRVYTLMQAISLGPEASWAPVCAPFIPDPGPEVTEEAPAVGHPRRFYRVTAEPPLP